MESVVGPLLVEEPLEVAATAGGESLEGEGGGGLNVPRRSLCAILLMYVSSQLS